MAEQMPGQLQVPGRDRGLAVLACAGFWLLPVAWALGVRLAAARRPYVRFYSTTAVNLQATWLVVAVALGTMSQTERIPESLAGACGVAGAAYAVYGIVASIDLLVAAESGRLPRYRRFLSVLRSGPVDAGPGRAGAAPVA